jgi:RimJ/RimL family protein N-acetyltransferase
MIILESQRLILREFLSSDLAIIAALLSDPKVMEFSLGLKTEVEAEAWLKECQKQYIKEGFGIWAVVRRDSREVIGYCGLSEFADADGESECEIVYRLKENEWGSGFATEAALPLRTRGQYESQKSWVCNVKRI